MQRLIQLVPTLFVGIALLSCGGGDDEAPVTGPEVVETLFARPGKRHARAAWVLLFFALWHNCHILGRDHEGTVFDVLAAGN